MDSNILPVELEKAYRLVTHGPTVLVSASHGGVVDVMAAAWCCALDFAPPKLTVVLDKITRTRELVERSGRFVIQVPNLAQLALVNGVGNNSLHDNPDKLQQHGVELFSVGDNNLPLVAGCSAWLACELVSEPHNQQSYDLFIGEVTAAWADQRIFRQGHWLFEQADARWKSLHHVAGGHYYAIGDAVES
ncbi:flavin reductase family protein [Cellvibrio polysaccharolyticus]|uniref:Flavin reductase family protein n=1 Tax=Cellvibrio polysaccharolyticus TaxID=2082724 RepID=A0A928YUY7_9GAMM|nr:flavin reductase family protein [Cellvibrio polysaccharolyticus]MBE8718467.1 flavin reductase family protein [Cellvibrio polysaccharolyticus]